MNIYLKLSLVWNLVKSLFVKRNGAWVQVKQGWLKTNGAWKQFYASQILPPLSVFSTGYFNDGGTGTFTPGITQRTLGQQFYVPAAGVNVIRINLAADPMGTNYTSGVYDLDAGDAQDYSQTKLAMQTFINDTGNAQKIVIVMFHNFTDSNPKAGLLDAWQGGGNLKLTDKILSTVDLSSFVKPSYVAVFYPPTGLFFEMGVEGDQRTVNIATEVVADLQLNGTVAGRTVQATYS